MANLLYPAGKKAILDADVDFLVDTIKIALVKTAYVYSSAHDFLDDLGANRVGTDATLGGKSTTGGVFDATDPTWTALSSTEVSYAVIYKDTGVDATSQLIAYLDTITGFPFTPSGADYTVVFDSGANKIFAL